MRALTAAAILAIAIVVATGCGGGDQAADNRSTVEAAEMKALLAAVPQRETALGDRGAGATLVEFTDLRCGACRAFELKVLPTIVRRYVRPRKLLIELRVIGLNGRASLEAAAWAAAAARQDRLYQFVDLLYRSAEETPAKVAASAELDVVRARRFARSKNVRRRLARTTEQARDSGLRRPPAFFVGRRGGPVQRVELETKTPASVTATLDGVIARP